LKTRHNVTDHDTSSRDSADRLSGPLLTLYRCERSHAFFFPHQTCPLCGAALGETESSPDGVLVCHTTVRVSPTGAPFKLGLARVACGAQTLCIVEGEIGTDPGEEVVILKKDGLYYAKPQAPR
jgi:uncharacterized OB-fold protein